MKTFLTFMFICLTTSGALACMPPQTTYQQEGDMQVALRSPAYKQLLNIELEKENYNLSIRSIDFEDGVRVRLSNNCDIIVTINYSFPEEVGSCPEVDQILGRTICK